MIGYGLRCAMGCETWPDDPNNYGTCFACGEETKRYSSVEALSEEEAISKANNYLFEDFYEDWDLSHSPDRLQFGYDPDELLLIPSSE